MSKVTSVYYFLESYGVGEGWCCVYMGGAIKVRADGDGDMRLCLGWVC
jgi:hypothetical protein